jgi:hypothetical protein
MRLLLSVLVAILFLITLSNDVLAQQDQFETISFVYVELRFDEGNFETMKRTTETDGITPADLGSWMERSGNVMIKGEVTMSEPISEISGSILFYAFDSRGSMTGRESTEIQLTERPASLGQLTRGSLPRLIDGLMAYDAFMAVDMFLPQMNETDSFAQVEQQMRSAVQRVMGASGTDYAIAALAVPEGREYDFKVSPGLVIFTGRTR